jgi:hypothetical protein
MGLLFCPLQRQQASDSPSTSAKEEHHPLGGATTVGWRRTRVRREWRHGGHDATSNGDGALGGTGGCRSTRDIHGRHGAAGHGHDIDDDGEVDGATNRASGGIHGGVDGEYMEADMSMVDESRPSVTVTSQEKMVWPVLSDA